MRYVICGPPGSGKTTWVKERAKKGDIVWDFDAVAAVIGNLGEPLQPRSGKWLPGWVVDATMEMRKGLFEWLQFVPLKEAAVYVIVADELRARIIAMQIHAEVVTLKER